MLLFIEKFIYNFFFSHSHLSHVFSTLLFCSLGIFFLLCFPNLHIKAFFFFLQMNNMIEKCTFMVRYSLYENGSATGIVEMEKAI